MSERTLQDALVHANHLRDFRKINSDAFERSADYQDIILLADEVERLTAPRSVVPPERAESTPSGDVQISEAVRVCWIGDLLYLYGPEGEMLWLTPAELSKFKQFLETSK